MTTANAITNEVGGRLTCRDELLPHGSQYEERHSAIFRVKPEFRDMKLGMLYDHYHYHYGVLARHLHDDIGISLHQVIRAAKIGNCLYIKEKEPKKEGDLVRTWALRDSKIYLNKTKR